MKTKLVNNGSLRTGLKIANPITVAGGKELWSSRTHKARAIQVRLCPDMEHGAFQSLTREWSNPC